METRCITRTNYTTLRLQEYLTAGKTKKKGGTFDTIRKDLSGKNTAGLCTKGGGTLGNPKLNESYITAVKQSCIGIVRQSLLFTFLFFFILLLLCEKKQEASKHFLAGDSKGGKNLIPKLHRKQNVIKPQNELLRFNNVNNQSAN